MRIVWKYAIDVGPFSASGGQIHQVPKGAKFLQVAAQDATIAIWFEVDPDAPYEERRFRYFGTGFVLHGEDLTYLGTCLFAGGSFVVHVYEVPSE